MKDDDSTVQAIASNRDKQMTDGSEAAHTIVVKFHLCQSCWCFVSGDVNKFCLPYKITQ